MFERWFKKSAESLFVSYADSNQTLKEWEAFKKKFESSHPTQALEITKIKELHYRTRILYKIVNRKDWQIEKMKEALEYYADPFHYEKHCSDNGKDIEEILLDKGRIANSILMELENDISGSAKKN